MIDGYSVQEAASVLGVPEGRVWELLARGVLSGTPEGDSMRVFLKSQPGPIATAGTRQEEPPRTNGNGGSHGAEASAFRELLTEFRNLTERYGQALLALGEARGEVAGLRSRIDLLEARLDLRLPPGHDEAPIAWGTAASASIQQPREPTAPPPATARTSPRRRAAPEPTLSKASRSKKAATSRSAVAGFAEALARAQDPTTAEMPGSEASEPIEVTAEVPAVAEAVNEVVDEAAAEPLTAATAEMADEAVPELEAEVDAEVAAELDAEVEAGLDAELLAEAPAAGPVAPDAVSAPSYSADVVEPDWFADGDFAWLDVAEIEARGVTAPEASAPGGGSDVEAASEAELAPAAAAAEAEPRAEAEPPPELEPPAEAEPHPVAAEAAVPEAQISAAWEPDPRAEAPIEPSVATEPLASFEIASEPASEPTPVAEPEAPIMGAVTPEPSSATDAGSQLEAVTMVEPPGEPGGVAEAPGVPAGRIADEEELMWLGDRGTASPAAAADIQVAVPGWRPEAPVAPVRDDAISDEAWPASDSRTLEEPRPLALTEEELARLARDEGWDAAEVAAIRAMISTSSSAPRSPQATSLPSIELPGASELDEAMAALGTGPAASPADPARAWAKAPPQRDEPAAHEEWAYESEPPSVFRQPQPFSPVPPARRSAPDPNWLRTRRGPAATAYRRLRRLFPG